MPWWAWIAAGAALLATELAIPADFWLVFLGLAALATGALDGLGLLGAAPWLEWAAFGVLAVVSAVFFRRLVRPRAVQRRSDGRVDDALAGEIGIAQQTLAPGGLGRVELRGTTWSARNAGAVPIDLGMRVRVEAVEGLTLQVRPAE